MKALLASIRDRVAHPAVRDMHNAVDAALWGDGPPPTSDLAALCVRMLGNLLLMTPPGQRINMTTAVGFLGNELATYMEQLDREQKAGQP